MKVKENKKSPTFSLDSTTLKTFDSRKIKGGLVVYFYPRDNTPGCTLETKDFTKLYKKFKSLSFEVVGISKDNIKSHLSFKKKYNVPVELLSDEKTIVLKKYKAWGLKKFLGKEYYGIIRSTVLINEKGKIVKTWSNVRVKDHVKNVINELSNI